MNNEEKITPAATEQPPSDPCAGIPAEFHPVVKQYGREMFALVMDAGLCSQATQVLATLAEKHRSRGALHAVSVLSRAFNQISTAYCKQMGWDEGILAQCDRDIGLAFAGKIQTPDGKLILNA